MLQRVTLGARQNHLHRTAALVIIVWLAFALRVAGLDRRPLWWDEGVSIYTAHLLPADLLRATAADVHLPTYFLLLRGWGLSVGWCPFLVRFPSVLAGVLAVVSLYPLGRRIVGPKTVGAPLGAMSLAAVLPVGLYLAQEARMYAGVLLLGTWSWYALLRAIASPKSAVQWSVYFGVTLLALYTHYTVLFVLGAQILYVALTTRRWRSILCRWSLQVIAALVLVFWVVYVASSLSPYVSGHLTHDGRTVGLLTFLNHYASYAAAGFDLTLTRVTASATVVLSALAVSGLALAARRHTSGDWVVLTWCIVPSVSMWVFGLWYHYEGELTRPLLALNAPALMLAANVVPSYPLRPTLRAIAVTALAGMILLTIPTLVHYYAAAPDPAEDYRPLIDRVRTLARPNDAALTAYVWQDAYFSSYAPDLPLAFYRNTYNAETVPSVLETIFESHHQLWVINYLADVHDTLNPLNIWLNHNAALAFDEWYGNTQLSLFVREGNPPTAWLGQATFERSIHLNYALPNVSARPGDVLSLDLRWQTAAPLERALKVFVHLRQPDGEPIAQSDSEPAGGFDPTDTWQPGRLVLDRRALLVPRNTPPGTYAVYAGLYNPEDGSRLQVISPSAGDTSDSVVIGHVNIAGRSN